MAVLTLGYRRVMGAKLWRHCGLLPLLLQLVRPQSFTPVSVVDDPDVAVPVRWLEEMQQPVVP